MRRPLSGGQRPNRNSPAPHEQRPGAALGIKSGPKCFRRSSDPPHIRVREIRLLLPWCKLMRTNPQEGVEIRATPQSDLWSKSLLQCRLSHCGAERRRLSIEG